MTTGREIDWQKAAQVRGWVRELMREETLRTTDKLTGLILRDYVNRETGNAYPSNATLADQRGISDRRVRDNLRALEEAGYFTRSPKSRPGRVVMYRLALPVQVLASGPPPEVDLPDEDEADL